MGFKVLGMSRGGEGGRASPPPPQTSQRRVGSRLGGGDPPPRGAGAGSQEQRLLNAACGPRGCARGGSGGGGGAQRARLPGEQVCRERRGELSRHLGCAVTGRLWKESYSVAGGWAVTWPVRAAGPLAATRRPSAARAAGFRKFTSLSSFPESFISSEEGL